MGLMAAVAQLRRGKRSLRSEKEGESEKRGRMEGRKEGGNDGARVCLRVAVLMTALDGKGKLL